MLKVCVCVCRFFSSILFATLFTAELKPTAEHVKIYSVRMKENEKKPMKVYCVTLANLWQQGHQLRINNVADRTKKAHPEKDILAQVSVLPGASGFVSMGSINNFNMSVLT